MLLQTLGDKTPQIDPSARGAENAAVIGDVALGEDVTVWYGCTIRGDDAPISVGAGTNIQDNCVLHCGSDSPLTLGRQVVVGHGAIVHGCTVADGCLIGMGSIILDGAVIGAGSIVGAGALVTGQTEIPPGSLVLGVPGKVVRPVTSQERADTLENARHYVQAGREQLPLIHRQENPR